MSSEGRGEGEAEELMFVVDEVIDDEQFLLADYGDDERYQLQDNVALIDPTQEEAAAVGQEEEEEEDLGDAAVAPAAYSQRPADAADGDNKYRLSPAAATGGVGGASSDLYDPFEPQMWSSLVSTTIAAPTATTAAYPAAPSQPEDGAPSQENGQDEVAAGGNKTKQTDDDTQRVGNNAAGDDGYGMHSPRERGPTGLGGDGDGDYEEKMKAIVDEALGKVVKRADKQPDAGADEQSASDDGGESDESDESESSSAESGEASEESDEVEAAPEKKARIQPATPGDRRPSRDRRVVVRRRRSRSSGQKQRRRSQVSAADAESADVDLSFIHENAAYFLIKSGNSENVSLSKAKGVWATTGTNERVLNKKFRECKNVILIFSVERSSAFQGYARLASASRHNDSPVNWVLPPHMDPRRLGGIFRVDWIARRPLSFDFTQELINHYNEDKQIKIGRDGTAIEPAAARHLCSMFPRETPSYLRDIRRRLRPSPPPPPPPPKRRRTPPPPVEKKRKKQQPRVAPPPPPAAPAPRERPRSIAVRAPPPPQPPPKRRRSPSADDLHGAAPPPPQQLRGRLSTPPKFAPARRRRGSGGAGGRRRRGSSGGMGPRTSGANMEPVGMGGGAPPPSLAFGQPAPAYHGGAGGGGYGSAFTDLHAMGTMDIIRSMSAYHQLPPLVQPQVWSDALRAARQLMAPAPAPLYPGASGRRRRASPSPPPPPPRRRRRSPSPPAAFRDSYEHRRRPPPRHHSPPPRHPSPPPRYSSRSGGGRSYRR